MFKKLLEVTWLIYIVIKALQLMLHHDYKFFRNQIQSLYITLPTWDEYEFQGVHESF